jgi:hypothetical protein
MATKTIARIAKANGTSAVLGIIVLFAEEASDVFVTVFPFD